MMKTQSKLSLSDKMRELVTKRPAIPAERRTACQLEILQDQARDLDAEVLRLQERTAVLSTRAQTTPSPTHPPPVRDPLFEPGENAPPSQHQAQTQAYNALFDEWRIFNLEVQEFEKAFKTFSTQMGGMQKKIKLGPGKAMGRNEHNFEALENALGNLGQKRIEVEKGVKEVGLPIVKPVKGKK
jgi:hypothetical protein